jgi:hypothetical protein
MRPAGRVPPVGGRLSPDREPPPIFVMSPFLVRYVPVSRCPFLVLSPFLVSPFPVCPRFSCFERLPHFRPRRSSRHPSRERHPGQMIVLPRCCSVSRISRPQSGHANLLMMPPRSCQGSPQAGHSPRSPSGEGTIGPSYPQATQSVSRAVDGDSEEVEVTTQEEINSSAAGRGGLTKPHARHDTSVSAHAAPQAGQMAWMSMTCSSMWRWIYAYLTSVKPGQQASLGPMAGPRG